MLLKVLVAEWACAIFSPFYWYGTVKWNMAIFSNHFDYIMTQCL